MSVRRVATGVAILAALGVAAAVTAPQATAGEILRRCSIVGCDPQILFRARDGEVNSLIFSSTSLRAGRVYFADATSPFTLADVSFPYGNDCRYETDSLGLVNFAARHVVSCPESRRTTIVLVLGDRDDRVEAPISRRFQIFGGSGDDTIDARGDANGGDDSSFLFGEQGNDDLRGGVGADLLVGGPGRDVLNGDAGPDELSGGPGEDVVDYDISWRRHDGVRVSIGAGQGDDGGPQDGEAGHRDTVRGDVEEVRGTEGDDVLVGDADENTLTGLAGDDVILGLGGRDTLLGGGVVRRNGRPIFIPGGTNRLDGGPGDDTLIGGFESDFLQGGEGNDVLRGDDAAPRIEGADVLHGGPGSDLLDAGRDPRSGRARKEQIFGDAGVDTVTYEVRTAGLSISLDNLANDGEAHEGDNVHTDVERVLGGNGDDRLTGSRLDNALIGNGGNDALDGGPGRDDLVGGPGPRDSVRYSTRTDRVQISLDDSFNDGQVNEEDNVRRSVEVVYGGLGDDLIVGNELANFLYGSAGQDELRGGGGKDVLEGEAGNDLLFAADGIDDIVRGGADLDCAQIDQGLDVVELVESFFPCAAPPPPPPPPPSPGPPPPPSPPPPPAPAATQCANGKDDDGDGKVDLSDPGCTDAKDDSESPDPALPQCANDKDDDGDGLVDLADPGCENAKDDSESPDPKLPQCSNGKDDDGDGAADYPNDKQCTSKEDDDESK